MKKSMLHLTRRIALSHLPKHCQFDFYIHYSFIFQRNSLLDWSTNKVAIPEVHFGYHRRLANPTEGRFSGLPKLHAELAAFRKTRGLIDFRKPWEIVNIRLNKIGELRLSAPCSCCFGFLKELGCVRFHYSYDHGFLTIN